MRGVYDYMKKKNKGGARSSRRTTTLASSTAWTAWRKRLLAIQHNFDGTRVTLPPQAPYSTSPQKQKRKGVANEIRWFFLVSFSWLHSLNERQQLGSSFHDLLPRLLFFRASSEASVFFALRCLWLQCLVHIHMCFKTLFTTKIQNFFGTPWNHNLKLKTDRNHLEHFLTFKCVVASLLKFCVFSSMGGLFCQQSQCEPVFPLNKWEQHVK